MAKSSTRKKTKERNKRIRSNSQGMSPESIHKHKMRVLSQAQMLDALRDQFAAEQQQKRAQEIDESSAGIQEAIENKEISMNQQLLMSSMQTEIAEK